LIIMGVAMLQLAVLLLVNGAAAKTANINGKELTLQHVQILYRHGDRSPTDIAPADPNNWTKWPQGFGQLSTRGMNQHWQLGQLIAQTYATGSDALLSSTYKHAELYAASDEESRCLMSAASNFAGLYPACGQTGCPTSNGWPSTWSPVPIHTMPQATDFILTTPDCPALTKANENFMLTNGTAVQTAAEFADIAAQVSKIAGYNYTLTLDNMWLIWDPLYVEINWGNLDGVTIAPPNWTYTIVPGNATYRDKTYTNQTLYEWVTIMNNIGTDWMYEDDTSAKFAGGPILNQFIDVMTKKVQYNNIEPTDKTLSGDAKTYGLQKYFAYSAHDTTIWALLRAMNDNLQYVVIPASADDLPKYAAAIAFELWGPANSTQQSDFYINIQYHDGIWYNNTVQQPSAPGWNSVTGTTVQCRDSIVNESYCALGTFIANSAPYAPYTNDAMPQLCNPPTPNTAANAHFSYALLLLTAAIGVIGT